MQKKSFRAPFAPNDLYIKYAYLILYRSLSAHDKCSSRLVVFEDYYSFYEYTRGIFKPSGSTVKVQCFYKSGRIRTNKLNSTMIASQFVTIRSCNRD